MRCEECSAQKCRVALVCNRGRRVLTLARQVFTNLSEYSDHGSPVQPEEPQSTGEAKDAGADGADAAGVVEEEGEDVLVSLSALSLVAERCISVRRTYSAFVQARLLFRQALDACADAAQQAREALVQRGLPGASELPELPGKSYFASSADARTLATRRAAFNALLQHVGRHEALACSDVMCAFLSGAQAARAVEACPGAVSCQR